MPVPPGYTVVERPAKGLTTGGVVGLSVSYAAAVIVGASQGFENGTGWLAVPLVGPWGAIATRKYECKAASVAEARRCVNNAVGEVQLVTFMAMDGLAQTAGALVTLAGLLSTQEELVRSDLVEVSLLPPLPGREAFDLSVRAVF